MSADHLVETFEFDGNTHRGNVNLGEFLETQNQIDRAVEIAKNADGVRKVIN